MKETDTPTDGTFDEQLKAMERGQQMLVRSTMRPIQQAAEAQWNLGKMFLRGLELNESLQRTGTDVTRTAFQNYLDSFESAATDATQEVERELRETEERQSSAASRFRHASEAVTDEMAAQSTQQRPRQIQPRRQPQIQQSQPPGMHQGQQPGIEQPQMQGGEQPRAPPSQGQPAMTSPQFPQASSLGGPIGQEQSIPGQFPNQQAQPPQRQQAQPPRRQQAPSSRSTPQQGQPPQGAGQQPPERSPDQQAGAKPPLQEAGAQPPLQEAGAQPPEMETQSRSGQIDEGEPTPSSSGPE